MCHLQVYRPTQGVLELSKLWHQYYQLYVLCEVIRHGLSASGPFWWHFHKTNMKAAMRTSGSERHKLLVYIIVVIYICFQWWWFIWKCCMISLGYIFNTNARYNLHVKVSIACKTLWSSWLCCSTCGRCVHFCFYLLFPDIFYKLCTE